MDSDLFRDVDAVTPDFNPVIARGLAVRELDRAKEEIDNHFLQISKQYPKELGITIRPGVQCTPEETRAHALRARKSIQTYELSESTLYLMKYQIEMHGERLAPVLLYLPYVRQAGIATIDGSKFSISPVLADIAMSIGSDNIFIYMGKSKITFKRLYHECVVDGIRTPGYIVWCKAHNSAARATELSKKTSNYHYIFAKYGVTEAFKLFAGCQVAVGNAEINSHNYPDSQWVIAESTRIKPRGKTGIYIPTTIRIAFPRTALNNEAVKDMLLAFYYMVDHFPESIVAEYVDDIYTWRNALGQCIFRETSEQRPTNILPKMNDHMKSIDNTLDASVKAWLKAEEIYVNDTYELFHHIAVNFTAYVSGSAKKLSSMYGKRLIVLRYVLDNLISGINNTLFDIDKLARKSKVTKEDIEKVFQNRLPSRLVSKINQKHAEVSSVSSACDSMIPKITSVMILQSNMSGTQSSKSKSSSYDETNALDATIAEVAGFNNISKSVVDGRGKTSAFLQIRLDGLVDPDPRFRDLIDESNAIIHGD